MVGCMVEENDFDFITAYKEAILKDIPTNEYWAEDIAVVLLSTVCSKVYTYTDVGKFSLNIWTNAIAASGIGNKTSPLKEYLIPTLVKMMKLKTDNSDYRLPVSFTTESMSKHMAEKQRNGIIVKDEVSKLFKEIRGNSYTQQLIEFLSELYDGRVDKRYTITHGLKDIEECYITFIGATTPYIYNILDKSTFVQGLGNRILFEVYKMDRPTTTPSKRYGNSESKYRERLISIENFAKFLNDVDKLNNLHVIIDENSEAAKMLVDFDNSLSDQINSMKDNDLRRSYFDRIVLTTNKLAVLKAISSKFCRLNIQNLNDLYELPVETVDAVWAINKAKRHMRCFEQMLEQWETKPKIKEVVSEEANFKAIRGVVESNEDGIATAQEILVALNWPVSGNKYKANIDLICSASINDSYLHMMNKVEIEELSEEKCKRHRIDKKKSKYVFRRLDKL